MYVSFIARCICRLLTIGPKYWLPRAQSHPLRISANLMRKRSHDLLSYIQDSNDVKTALTDWLAQHTSLSAAEAKLLQKGGELPSQSVGSATPDASLVSGPLASAAAASNVAGKKPMKAESYASTGPVITSFEDQLAFVPASGAVIAEAAVEVKRAGERDMLALSNLIGDEWDSVDGVRSVASGSRPRGSSKPTQPIFEAQSEEEEVEQLFRQFANGNSAGATLGPKIGNEAESATTPWSGQSSAERINVALPTLPSSQLAAVPPSHDRPSKRKRWRPRAQEADHSQATRRQNDTGHASPSKRHAVSLMKGNISTLRKMKKLKERFDILESCLDNEAPLPSNLLVDSDDEDGDSKSTARNKGHPRHSEADQSHESNPFPHLSIGHARARLNERICLIVGNAGFEASHVRPMDVLSSLLEEFLLSLGRTMRLYTDRYGGTMTSEEIVLHTLHATSGMSPNDLAQYISEDTVRYQNRLQDLRHRLEASWKERIAIGEERLITEEDARFFGEESDDIVAGNLPSALDDDFFGFKAMGLDQELGVSNMSVPMRLLQRRPMGKRDMRNGDIGANAGSREGESKDPFPAPRPFVRLSEAAVPVQIGLLRSYYRDLLHRRGHRRGPREQEDGEAEGKSAEYDDNQEEDEDEGILALSDEEQERTSRYKVPPTGKMPKREFWSREGPTSAIKGSAGASAGSKDANKASAAGSTKSGKGSGMSNAASAGAGGPGKGKKGKGAKKG